MAYDGGTAVVRVVADAKSLNASIAAQTKGAGAMGKLASTLSNPFVLAGVAVAGVATKLALDFEGAFTRIAAISNASAKDIAAWKTQVLSLAGETAQAPQELADALFFLSSAGLEASQIMPVLEASAKASAAGLGDTADIAKITANALNAYADSGLTATEVTDSLVAAVREGSAEPEEFAAALGRILPIASQVGVTFDQVTGSLAGLSNIGLDVNEAVTAMRGTLQAVSAPGTQAASALHDLGLSAQDLLDAISEKGLFGALQMLDKAAKNQTKTQAQYIGVLRKIIPNVRALTGVLGLTGQKAAKVQAIFDATADSTGALNDAFEETQKGPAFQFQKALNELVVILTELGQELLPTVLQLVKLLAPAFQQALNFIKPFSQTLGELGDKISALNDGPLYMLPFRLKESADLLGSLKGVAGPVASALGLINSPLADSLRLWSDLPDNIDLSATAVERMGQAVLTGKVSLTDFNAAIQGTQFEGQGLSEVLAQQARQAAMASDGIAGLSDHLIEIPGPADKVKDSLHGVANGAKLTKNQIEKLGKIMEDVGPQFDALSGGLFGVEQAFKETSQGAADAAQDLGKHQTDIANDLKKLDDIKVGDKLKARIATLGPDMVHAFVQGNSGQRQAIIQGLNVYQQAVRTSNRILAGIMRRGGITAGQNLAEGAEIGVTSKAQAAADAAARMGHQMLEALNDSLEESSASKATMRSGAFFVEGLIKGMDQRSKGLVRMVQKLGDLIKQALDDEIKDAVSKSQLDFAKGLEKRINQATNDLDRLVSKFRSFKDTIRGGFSELGNLAGLVTGFPAQVEQQQADYLAKQQELLDQIATASQTGNTALVALLQAQLDALEMPNMNLGSAIEAQVAQAQELAKLLADAAKAGLSKGLLAQFAGQGAAAIPALTELLANPELIGALNQAQQQIAKAAGDTAEALGEKFFGKAIKTATRHLDHLADALVRFVARLQNMLGSVSAGIAAQLAAIQQQAQAAQQAGSGSTGTTGGGGGTHHGSGGPWSPPNSPPTGGSGGSGNKPHVTVNVTGWVGNDQDIANRVRNELLRVGRNNSGTGL